MSWHCGSLHELRLFYYKCSFTSFNPLVGVQGMWKWLVGGRKHGNQQKGYIDIVNRKVQKIKREKKLEHLLEHMKLERQKERSQKESNSPTPNPRISSEPPAN